MYNFNKFEPKFMCNCCKKTEDLIVLDCEKCVFCKGSFILYVKKQILEFGK